MSDIPTEAATKPGLSIVVPCLDEAATIATMLQRLVPLRINGAEVIVVDGGSDDDTLAVAAPHADLALVAPRGRAVQMNAGAERASGDVLLFLHADTSLPPDADTLIRDALARPLAMWGRFDVEIEGRSFALRVVSAAMNVRSRWTGIATGDQAIFIKRSEFERVGRYPPIALMEDVALSRKLKAASAPVCLRRRVRTSGRRWQTHGTLRTIFLMWRLRLAYWLGTGPQKLASLYAHRK